MKLIVGLGNPGKEYEKTRHNVGFFFADKLRELWDFPEFEFSKKFDAEISVSSRANLEQAKRVEREAEGSNQKIILAKPAAFMNLSGVAVRAILDFYKLTAADIIVIHDDLDIAVGKYKIATDSSSAGHNGVQNIIDQLGTQKFKRIRIGIGIEASIEDSMEDSKNDALEARLPRRSSPRRTEAGDYVLDKFSEDETEKIKEIEKNIFEEIDNLLQFAGQ